MTLRLKLRMFLAAAIFDITLNSGAIMSAERWREAGQTTLDIINRWLGSNLRFSPCFDLFGFVLSLTPDSMVHLNEDDANLRDAFDELLEQDAKQQLAASFVRRPMP